MNSEKNERSADLIQVKSEEHQADRLVDLPVSDEQAEETRGGMLLPAVQAAREAANHNETLTKDTDEAGATSEALPEALEDLPVSDEQSDAVAGGLPAVQKVREAAARIDC